MELFVVTKGSVFDNKFLESGVKFDGIYLSETSAANRVRELIEEGYSNASFDLYHAKP